MWMNLVYDFLCSYDRAPDRAGKLKVIKALKPLYLARVVSFIRETLELDHTNSEKKILRQAEVFRSHRHIVVQNLASKTPTTSSVSSQGSSSNSLSMQ